MTDSSTFLELAAQIVSAHVSKNEITPDQLPRLINDVHRALSSAGQVATTPPRGQPAVAMRQSIRHDHLVCLECGRHLSMLKRHLMHDHQLTPEQYRRKWELP